MIYKIWLGFASFIILVLALTAAVSMVIISTGVHFGVISADAKASVVWIFIILPILWLISMLLTSRIYHKILSAIYTVLGVWLGILIFLFLGAVVLSLIYIIGGILGASLNMFTISWAVIIAILVATIYGITNASRIQTTTYEFTSKSLAPQWAGKNIVLVTDTHLGVVRSGKFMQRVVTKIQSLNPDMVLIAGDIIDGPVFNYAQGLEPLRNLKSTYGVFYTPGNHEKYNSESAKFFPVVQSVTKMLVDARTEVNGTQIIGLDYKAEPSEATKARLLKTGYEKNKPAIVMLHDPKNTLVIREEGVSLVVSGHTHKGQFFPLTSIVHAMYKKLSYGLQTDGEMASITTSGVGTAMVPIRIGTKAEIVLIRITK